jgi:hypothetical protein
MLLTEAELKAIPSETVVAMTVEVFERAVGISYDPPRHKVFDLVSGPLVASHSRIVLPLNFVCGLEVVAFLEVIRVAIVLYSMWCRTWVNVLCGKLVGKRHLIERRCTSFVALGYEVSSVAGRLGIGLSGEAC